MAVKKEKHWAVMMVEPSANCSAEQRDVCWADYLVALRALKTVDQRDCDLVELLVVRSVGSWVLVTAGSKAGHSVAYWGYSTAVT